MNKSKRIPVESTKAELQGELKKIGIFHKTLEQAMANIEKAKTKVDALAEANFSSQLKKAYDRINESAFSFVSPTFLARKI